MQQIKLNSRIKKLSRKDAFAMIENILINLDDSQLEAGLALAGVTKDNIEAAYKYFMPAPPKTAKTRFEKVAKFVAGVKDIRTFLQYVYVNDGVMYATDGHIGIRTDTTKPDGFYCPKSAQLVEVDQKYPQLDRVMDGVKPTGETLELDMLNLDTKMHGNFEYVPLPDSDLGLQVQLLRRATNNADNVTIKLSEDIKNAVTIESDWADIVIMPMRTK